MARSNLHELGAIPPQIIWTIVRGDTASFRMFVTDDAKIPLLIQEWTIDMDIKRNGEVIISVTPQQKSTDGEGEFTVSLSSEESRILETNDIFDIQLSNDHYVWTVAQGKLKVIEDVTL